MRGRLPKTGTYTGTGAVINVVLGFKPKAVRIFNYTDGDVEGYHQDTMPAASAFKIVDSGTDTTNLSKVTSDGITLTATGFSVGVDAHLNESSDVYHYIAY